MAQLNITIKKFIKKLLKVLPGEGIILININRRIYFSLLRGIIKVRSSFSKHSAVDSDIIYWINPNRIIGHTNYIKNEIGRKTDFKERVFNLVTDKGKVLGGDWDITPYRFSDLKVYKSTQQRILDGINWQKTEFYQECIGEIGSGRVLWGCSKKQQLDKRFDELDFLIKDIKEKGYKQSSDVDVDINYRKKALSKRLIGRGEEILVNIGRDGQYLFQDGRHRLAIAQILQIEKVAVKVLVRHKKWAQFRDFLVAMAKSTRGATRNPTLYQPVLHPDLMDIPYAHSCEDRFRLIREHVFNKNTYAPTLLDIGTNLGYFCHKFEELGYKCFGIEIMPDIAWAADKIRKAEGKKFKLLQGNLFDLFENKLVGCEKFDLILSLNIFHHFLKTRELYLKFKKWLGSIQIKRMIFEPHLHDEEQMKNAYVNYKNDEFIDFIIQNTSLNQFRYLGELSDGRKLYMLFQ